jgi:catechol 2,3-dioxygenase-like lactoylglutathione lyase family enzyme
MLRNSNLIAFVPTRDADKARAFYERVLGLTFIKDDGFALVFESNGTRLRVSKVPQEFRPAQFAILGWEVSNIAEAVKNLTKNGVNFEVFGFFKQDELGIWSAPTGDKVAWFKDPDGNILSVSHHV